MTTATAPNKRDSHGVSLIEGEFSAREAREQLFKLYEDNIRYYGAKSFSEQIRKGSPDDYSEMKLRELSEAKSDALELIKLAQEQGLKVKIESDVKITLSRD